MKNNQAFLFLIFVLLSTFSHAQTDTIFWFAAPDISEEHGDSPLYFRFATFEQPTTVTISLPSINYTITTINIPANSQESYKVDNPSPFETEAGHINNKGILIESSNHITAYYEVARANNTDIFALKGKYALGMEFIIPMQNIFPNQSEIDAYSSVEVVATEDNTEIKFYSSAPLFTHDSSSLVTIVLDKGQSYAFRALTESSQNKLSGSRLISNKPVAVTGTDDSVLSLNYWDLIGDQIIPFHVAGTKYVLPEGYIAITSKNDQTFTINNIEYNLTDTNNHSVTFFNTTPQMIETSDTVIINYIGVFTGNLGEVGGAILPPLTCSGSREVAFIRSSERDFWIHLVYRTSSQNSFLLNNKPFDFSTDDIYQLDSNLSYVKIQLDEDLIPTNKHNRLQNSQAPFHLAIANGSQSTGFQLGYFSNFRNELEDTIYICKDYQNVNDFYADLDFYGEIKMDTLIRKSEDSSLVNFSVKDEYCLVLDTAWLIHAKTPDLNIADTLHICNDIDSLLTFEAHKVVYNDYIESKNFLIEGDSVKIYLENKAGCGTAKTVYINSLDSLNVTFPLDSSLCLGDEIDLFINGNYDSAMVNFSTYIDTLKITSDTTLIIYTSNKCGALQDTVNITGFSLPIVDLGKDREVCSLSSPHVNLPSNYSYIWQDQKTDYNYYFYASNLYSVTVTDSNKCQFSDSVNIIFKDIDSLPPLMNQKICEEKYNISIPPGHDTYLWEDGSSGLSRSLDIGTYSLNVSTFVNDTLCYETTNSFEIDKWNLAIPNVITPNNDGKNETFKILGLDKNFPLQLTVYNRWSKEIYHTSEYKNEWGNQDLAPGVYFFEVKSEGYNCTYHKGHLTVIK